MNNVITIKVMFVEDKPVVQKNIERYMEEYAFTREFAFDLTEFQFKFPRFKPDAVVVDYDLSAGKYHKEIFQICDVESRQTGRFIGLVGVTAIDPFPKIMKEFLSTGYHNAFFDDGRPEFYLNLISMFTKFQDHINGTKKFRK